MAPGFEGKALVHPSDRSLLRSPGMLQFIFKINNKIDTNAHGHADARRGRVAPTGAAIATARAAPRTRDRSTRELHLHQSIDLTV